MNNNIKPSLLIVDDNEKNLFATKRILEELNINIQTVLSGEEALKAVVNTEFFLILLDVQMPGMDGFETASIIHGNDNYKNIPIIFLTAIKKDEKYINNGYKEGAVDYIFKPFNAYILISKTKVFLDLYLKQKELDNLNKNLESLVERRTKDLNDSFKTLKLTQKQMFKSEKMASLGEMVAGVAHEINTPIGICLIGITHIESMTSAINKNFKDNKITQEDFEDFLQKSTELNKLIHTNLKQATELIANFKHTSVDQSSEEKYLFNLNEKVNHAVFSLRNNLKTTKIKVEVNCDESIQINTYPGAIYQIITNFISNSLIHGFDENDEGKIQINIYEENEEIYIKYKDTGKGIDKEVLPKIFDQFFTTNKEGGGSGIGMHIIYDIVTTKLNGTISVKSTKGKGVKFEIILDKDLT